MRLDGAFVECGCYRGSTAKVVADYLDLQRPYYLYDLFEHDPSVSHAMPAHGAGLYEETCARFANRPNVVVTKGRVPESLANAPERIAFLHLDLNNALSEVGALEVLWERMAPGALLILDDYGWSGYHEQRTAEDAWFAERGYAVLELPTGQGMVIR